MDIKKKKAVVAILISNKIDFKTKTITRDKEGYYIILKGSDKQEDTTLVKIYAPKIGAPKYVKKVNSNIVIVGDFNTPLSAMDRSSSQKMNKDIAVI